ncbi:MAG: MauE/DoxX family redox-associated membrane protein, partial [Actinomycetota bacterium]
ALGLAAVFGLAAAAKALRWRAWRRALTAYRIPAPLEGGAAIGVPLAEAAVPASILTGATELGAGLALVLLLGFSVAVLRAARTEGLRLPCGCFGRAGSRSVRAILARNLAFAGLAAAAVGSGRSPVPSFGPGDEVPALLASVGAALTGVLLVRAGRILRRDRA